MIMPSYELKQLFEELGKFSCNSTTSLDADLLNRFVGVRDERAFEAILDRHGQMVLRVCQRVLGHTQDAEDAFQATFLAFARKAASIRNPMGLCSWLYGTAYRSALHMRTNRERRRERPSVLECGAGTNEPADEAAKREVRNIVDDVVAGLPAKYSVPFILCCFEGKSKKEAAQELGWKEGTVSSRLNRARTLLRKRLRCRGVALSGAAVGAILSETKSPASVPARLAHITVRSALLASGSPSASGLVRPEVIAVAAKVSPSLFTSRVKITALIVFLMLVTAGAGAGAFVYRNVTASSPKPDEKEQPQLITRNADELDHRLAKALNGSDWFIFRGDPRRPSLAHGSTPVLHRPWKQSMLMTENEESESKVDRETKQMVEDALNSQQQEQARIPGFFPIALGDKVIYRSYWGIHARDIWTGELVWDGMASGSLNSMLTIDSGEERRAAKSWYSLYHQGGTQNIVFENSTVGSLSADEECVYAVDSLALPPHPKAQQIPSTMYGNGGRLVESRLREEASRGRLLAVRIEEGKQQWERGDPRHDGCELTQGSYFLGPPLALGGKRDLSSLGASTVGLLGWPAIRELCYLLRAHVSTVGLLASAGGQGPFLVASALDPGRTGKLYVLAEKNSELRLLCLEPHEGKPLWAQTLATTKGKMHMDPGRRVHAVHLAYADGILVCPTNAGTLLGVNLRTHKPIWAYKYGEDETETSPEQKPVVFQLDPARWRASAPVICDGRVLFTAPDDTTLHCLKLRDGAPLWKVGQADDLYLGGVHAGRVLLVGKNTCRALSLRDGTELWKVKTGMPSGLGVACDNLYYLPLNADGSRMPEVCIIDIAKGQIVAHRNSPDPDDAPGNLLFYKGAVLSQTATYIACYPQEGADLGDVLAKKNPRGSRDAAP
jgi:RNA polymerase sigma factor (sigma-70 family)